MHCDMSRGRSGTQRTMRNTAEALCLEGETTVNECARVLYLGRAVIFIALLKFAAPTSHRVRRPTPRKTPRDTRLLKYEHLGSSWDSSKWLREPTDHHMDICGSDLGINRICSRGIIDTKTPSRIFANSFSNILQRLEIWAGDQTVVHLNHLCPINTAPWGYF